MEPDIEIFANLIRSHRRVLGLSQEAVALQAFGNPDRKSYISALENQRKPRISIDTACKLAVALDIPLEALPPSLRPPSLRTPPSNDFQSLLPLQTTEVARAFNGQIHDALSRTVLQSYIQSLDRGLLLLKAWTGAAFGAQSLMVCFALSLWYVVFTGLVGYGFGGISVGHVAPFAKPEWAVAFPNWVLATGCGGTLIGTGILCYRLVSPPRNATPKTGYIAIRFFLGALFCGFGCALAGLLGADPTAVAMTVALCAFGAVSAWPPKIAMAIGIVGAFVAAIGNGFTSEIKLLSGFLEIVIVSVTIGAAAGYVASFVARAISEPIPASLAGAGAGLAFGTFCTGITLYASRNVTQVDAEFERVIILMWILFPFANALLDFISLGISQTAARWVRQNSRSWITVGCVAMVDLLLALVLMVLTVFLISYSLSFGEMIFRLDFASKDIVSRAVADPWGKGIWFTLMILTTMIWTYLHFAFVVAPVLSAHLVGALIEVPLRRRLAHFSEEGVFDTASGVLIPIRHGVFLLVWGIIAAIPVFLVARYFAMFIGYFI